VVPSNPSPDSPVSSQPTETVGGGAPPDDSSVLIASLVARSMDSNFEIMRQLYDGAEARLRAVVNEVRAALDASEWGGTTAQYEWTLRRVEAALTPPHEVLDFYLEQVRENRPNVPYRPSGWP